MAAVILPDLAPEVARIREAHRAAVATFRRDMGAVADAYRAWYDAAFDSLIPEQADAIATLIRDIDGHIASCGDAG